MAHDVHGRGRVNITCELTGEHTSPLFAMTAEPLSETEIRFVGEYRPTNEEPLTYTGATLRFWLGGTDPRLHLPVRLAVFGDGPLRLRAGDHLVFTYDLMLPLVSTSTPPS